MTTTIRAHLVAAALVLAYAVYFSVLTVLRHDALHTYAYDLGTFDQGIWLAGHSTDLFVTVRGLHLLGDHVRVLAFVLAPIYWIWDDVRFLLILQSVAIAAGGAFLYLIGRRELPNHPWAAAAVCASYLLNPAVQNLNTDHAHPDAFAQTFLLASVWFLRTERLGAFWAAAALAMCCKEDVPLVYVMLGVWLVFQRRVRLGSAVSAVAAAYFAVCMFVILPSFNDEGFFRSGGFFTELREHALDPSWLLAKFAGAEALHYYFLIGAPTAFLFVFSPGILIAAAPAVAANLLSAAHYTRTIEFHYTTSIVPFLYVATIWTLARAAGAERGGGAEASGRLPRGATAFLSMLVLLPATLATNVAYSDTPVGMMAENMRRMRGDPATPSPQSRAEVLAHVPKDAVVSADHVLVPHLSHRRRLYVFPNPFRAWNWGIRNERPHDPATIEYIAIRDKPFDADQAAMLASLVEAQTFHRIAGNGHVSVYRRSSSVELAAAAACGDWDGDGSVAALDVRRIAAAVSSRKECPPHVCDVDGDGKVTFTDVARLQRYVDKKDGEPACPPKSP